MDKRIAVIEKEKCNPIGCGGFLCVRVSPGNRMGNEVFYKGADGKAAVNEDVATDAESITAKKCPFGAIHMVKLPEQLTQRPIHRYGKDGFMLYSMPTPQFGKVTGIIGVNGVGKSTALKGLSGELMPNFGNPDNDGKFEIDKLIQMFKGTEAQNYFENLKAGNIQVAYKPQQIDVIAKYAKGKVIDLLKKVDEKNELEKYTKKLEIDHILENDISKISGGELQRVAICATVLKKANVYIFDEPTSYLDISQRIKLAKFLREQANEKTAVLVVEHDIVILDFLADTIHVMFGETGAYGIVSQPKQARTAINDYLAGFLKEENMRFRPNAITFTQRPEERTSRKEELLAWKNISKKYDNFKISANEGQISKKNIVGVFGENGIGKTTFVKLLAGVEKPDSGEITSKVKVAYKPQYLKSDSDELVQTYLDDAISKYKSQLIDPLNIEHLFLRQLKQLSGGELQRVSIAKVLSSDADLYLLDEPSAYLDVEQRLLIAKLVKERIQITEKTALIVDHDLVFLDTVSEDLIIFKGEPGRSGEVHGPYKMVDGMNNFLSHMKITLRRDLDSKRPRINKEGSRLDREQKEKNKFYYS